MWTWTHLMVSTIVLGPSPEMFLGTILPDAFDYLNWAKNFRSKKVNTKLLLKDRHKFNKRNNEGLVWEIDQMFHSFICTGLVVGLAYYSWVSGHWGWFNFLAAYALHTLADYLTHTDQIYPFFPFSKWGIKIGLLNYNPANPISYLFDISLLIVLLARLGWLRW